MNLFFFLIVLMAFSTAAWRELTHTALPDTQTPMELLSSGMIAAAGGAVTLALGLVGVMTLFLGLMKVAEAGGLLTVIARLIRPLMVRLFPDVPPDHPAMGAMILNMSANALGLGNAATPFGIRAMQELDKLNTHPGTASNAMAMFLAINTAGVTLLPTGVIALRASAGSNDPAGILPTTLFATCCATIASIFFVWFYQRFYPLPKEVSAEAQTMERPWVTEKTADVDLQDQSAYPVWVSILALLGVVAVIPLTIVWGSAISAWIVPVIMVSFLVFGWLRGVRIYEVFVEGAKDGFQVALRIIPYLVAILVAAGMFRASGAMDMLVNTVGGLTSRFGLPAEALPMALLRPLSGSGAYGVMSAIINDPAIGPDSYIGYLVTTLQGSTETTFYVLAVYFGAVQIRRLRHTLIAALSADVVAIMAAIAICSYLYA